MNRYEKKYLKYKKKYVDLKIEKQIKGGSMLSCSEYYNNSYNFDNYDNLINFLINIKNKNTILGNNSNIDYNNTILDELIKINFDLTNKYDELPEFVKIILNTKPKPAYILQLFLTKDDIEYYKSILTNTFIGNSFSIGYFITKSIHLGIDRRVINSILEILKLQEIENETINTWNSLTILLEFICCLFDSIILKKLGNYINDINNNLTKLPLQIVFLEDLLNTSSRRILKNLYENNENNNISYSYENFVLRDFLDNNKNINNIIPPSVILLLSIKLNPIINKKDNIYNINLRKLIQYAGYECDIFTNYLDIGENITNEIEEYIKMENNILRTEDSNLIDLALIPLKNDNIENNNINENNNLLLNNIGNKYKKIIVNIKNNIKNNTLTNILSNIDIFKNNDPNTRIKELYNYLIILHRKKDKLIKNLETASTNKIFGLFTSQKNKIEHKIKQINIKIKDINYEILLLQDNKNIEKDYKINYILTNILFLIGIGLEKINKDLCMINNESNITWRTFDKTLKIFDGKIFKIILFSSSKNLIHLLLQKITPFTTYLPFDIKRYFHTKLKLKTPQEIDNFNNIYDKYEKLIYQDFIHKDGYYYSDLDLNGNINNYPLFPSSKLLNEIKESII